LSVFDGPAPNDGPSPNADAGAGSAEPSPVPPEHGSAPQVDPTTGPAGWDFEVAPTRSAFRPRQRPPVPGLVYAELPIRGVAFLLDLAIVAVAISALSYPLGQISRVLVVSAGSDFIGVNGVTFAAVLGALLPPMVTFVAVTAPLLVYFWTTFRASPGQMTLGLFTVAPSSGVALPWQQALLRWLLLFGPAIFLTGFGSVAITLAQVSTNFDTNSDVLPAIAIYLLLGLGPVAWYALLAITVVRDRRGRGWHDKLAGSVVVRRDGSPS
jgi:uncharacterized RDD family membrane protein YckC